MDLDNVDCRRISDSGEPGIRCSCTIQETYQDEETGELEYSTEVQQVQFFFLDENERDRVFKTLQNIIDELLERKIRGDSKFGEDFKSIFDETGSVIPETSDTLRSDQVIRVKNSMRSTISTGTASTNRSKKRSYASGKETMRKQRLNRNKKKSGTLTKSTMKDVLTLDDIVSKYKGVLNDEKESGEVVFKVTFGPGSMGFALSSIKDSVGVFVGKLEEGGMAQIGGVTLGDKVLKVGEIIINGSMSWRDVIEVIKQQRSIVKQEGSNKLIIKYARKKIINETISKQKQQDKKEAIKKRLQRKKAKGAKREWTKRKNKSFGNRMASLKDISDRYTMKRDEIEYKHQKVENMFDTLISTQKSSVAKKCGYILKELYDTERKYLSSLYVLIDNYMKPLSKKKIDIGDSLATKLLMTKQESKALFGNVELLVKINENLLTGLDTGLNRMIRKSKGTEITVADVVLVFAPIFSQIMPFFKIYSHYAYQYSNALEVLNTLKENPVFKQELDRIETKKANEALNSLLMKPIARLCKYPLIFATLNDNVQKYLKEVATEAIETGEGDIDKLDNCLTQLLETSQIVADIASSVDVKVGTAKDLEKLYEIYLELGGPRAVKQFMIPSRRFIGKFQILIEDKQTKKAKMKQTWLYLFNDLVLFAVEGKGGKFFNTNRAQSFLQNLGTSVIDARSAVGASRKSDNGAKRKKSEKRTLQAKQLVQVKKQIKIDAVRVRKNAVPKDELHGFTFTETVRVTSLVKKSRKNKEEHEQHDSQIYRYEMWFNEKEQRDELLKLINAQVKAHKANVRAKKKINAKLKPELRKKQRQWKSKARKIRQRSMQKMEDEALNRSTRIEEIDLSNAAVEPVDE